MDTINTTTHETLTRALNYLEEVSKPTPGHLWDSIDPCPYYLRGWPLGNGETVRALSGPNEALLGFALALAGASPSQIGVSYCAGYPVVWLGEEV